MKQPHQYVATVYKQMTPVRNGKVFTMEGTTYHDHTARLIEVAKVTGTKEQCWSEAKKVEAYPVIEFRETKNGNC